MKPVSPASLAPRTCRATWRPFALSASRSSPPGAITIGRRAGGRLGAVPRRPTHASPAAGTARCSRRSGPAADLRSPHSWDSTVLAVLAGLAGQLWQAATLRKVLAVNDASEHRPRTSSGRDRATRTRPKSRPDMCGNIVMHADMSSAPAAWKIGSCRGRPRPARTPPSANRAKRRGRPPRLRLALLLAAVPCGTAHDPRTWQFRFSRVLFSRRQHIGNGGQGRNRPPVGCRKRGGSWRLSAAMSATSTWSISRPTGRSWPPRGTTARSGCGTSRPQGRGRPCRRHRLRLFRRVFTRWKNAGQCRR